MKYLCDTNVLIALMVEIHPHHDKAAAWFAGLGASDQVLFCRSTQLSVLRLLNQRIAIDYVPLSNREAWDAVNAFASDDLVAFIEEPSGVESLWREMSQLKTASPKVWMDAYLAAFAIRADVHLVSLDKDFQNFISNGLNLILLKN